MWEAAVVRYGEQPCLGSREQLGQEEELQPNGKVSFNTMPKKRLRKH